jgi:hypothetical protein
MSVPMPSEVHGYHQRANRNTPVSAIRKQAADLGKPYFAVSGRVYDTENGRPTRWTEIDVEMALTPEAVA